MPHLHGTKLVSFSCSHNGENSLVASCWVSLPPQQSLLLLSPLVLYSVFFVWILGCNNHSRAVWPVITVWLKASLLSSSCLFLTFPVTAMAALSSLVSTSILPLQRHLQKIESSDATMLTNSHQVSCGENSRHSENVMLLSLCIWWHTIAKAYESQ